MLKKCPIWSILKHHHPSKRLFFLAITNEVHEVLVIHFWQCGYLEKKPILIDQEHVINKMTVNRKVRWEDTLFLKWISFCSDQFSQEVRTLDVTAISVPLESVPLHNVQFDREPIMLLNCSQAVSSSERLSKGTPVNNRNNYEHNNNIIIISIFQS